MPKNDGCRNFSDVCWVVDDVSCGLRWIGKRRVGERNVDWGASTVYCMRNRGIQNT